MTEKQIQQTLKLHSDWRNCRPGGVRANLRGADLCGADLRDADLRDANLGGADLNRADLRDANLRDANLCGADLRGADLGGADLNRANLNRADLRDANLRDANLRDANLCGADLGGADLSGTNIPPLTAAQTSIVPESGAFEGWKKCQNDVLVRVRIPATAKRSSATGRKCRAEEVKVLEVVGAKVGVSSHDRVTEYRKGATVKCGKWGESRWDECAGGIHFFLTRVEAENY